MISFTSQVIRTKKGLCFQIPDRYKAVFSEGKPYKISILDLNAFVRVGK